MLLFRKGMMVSNSNYLGNNVQDCKIILFSTFSHGIVREIIVRLSAFILPNRNATDLEELTERQNFLDIERIDSKSEYS